MRSDILLRVLPVKLHGPRGTVKTHALLDEGSTVTLIERPLAKELGATGPRDPLTLRWTNAASQEDAIRNALASASLASAKSLPSS